MERKAFKVVRPEKGIKVHDTLTRLEYKTMELSFNEKSVYVQEHHGFNSILHFLYHR